MGTDQAGDRRAPVSRRGELTCVGPRLCDKPSKLAVLPTQLPRSDFAAQSYLPRPPAVAIHANKSRRSRRYDLRVAAEKGLGCVSQRRRRREMAGIGATSSLPRAPAKVCLLIRQPTLGSGDGDYSFACPEADLCPRPGDRLEEAGKGRSIERLSFLNAGRWAIAVAGLSGDQKNSAAPFSGARRRRWSSL